MSAYYVSDAKRRQFIRQLGDCFAYEAKQSLR